MKLLSLRISEHDANFCYFNGKDLQYYKSERKHQAKHHALELDSWEDEIYSVWGIRSNDLEEISIIFDPWHHGFEKQKENFFPAIENYGKFKAKTKVTRINHHYAHALSYWPITDSEPDVSIVIDGFGDYDKAWTVFKKDNLIEEGSHEYHGSIGTEMAHVGDMFSIRAEHAIDIAGKLMGLQSYGVCDNEFKNKLSNYGIYDILEIFDMKHWVNYKGNALVGNLTGINWIRTVHEYIGEVLVNFFTKHCNTHDRIFYSGGVAQNVVWNTKLKEHFPNLIIPPHCADEGLSIGGIEYLRRKYNLPKFKLDNFPYCQLDVGVEEPDLDTIQKAAELLANGKTVGWYQGNGEIGPRALGNRSILFNPAIINGKEIVNKIKNRETYRPFGASILAEYMEDYFYDMPDNPYMLYVGRVKKDKLDSITHVDGTCRVQTVSEDSSFKKLLERFRYLTNLPILLNTSLNIAGKPIAGNPNDAIEVFKNSPIDAMVIGNQIMLKNS